MTSVAMFAPSPPVFAKWPSTQPIGSMQTNVTRPTMPIGMSRSVMGKVALWPALRARLAAIALASPLTTGFTSFTNVQMAEMPIAPAPM